MSEEIQTQIKKNKQVVWNKSSTETQIEMSFRNEYEVLGAVGAGSKI